MVVKEQRNFPLIFVKWESCFIVLSSGILSDKMCLKLQYHISFPLCCIFDLNCTVIFMALYLNSFIDFIPKLNQSIILKKKQALSKNFNIQTLDIWFIYSTF